MEAEYQGEVGGGRKKSQPTNKNKKLDHIVSLNNSEDLWEC